jgi:hypothetical protein
MVDGEEGSGVTVEVGAQEYGTKLVAVADGLGAVRLPGGRCARLKMSGMGQNEPCHSLRRDGRSTSISGPARPAVSASGSGQWTKPLAR